MTPPMIAPVLFAAEFDGADAASGVAAAGVVTTLDVSVGGVVGNGLVCEGPLVYSEFGRAVDVNVTVEVGIVVKAEYRSVVRPPPQPM